MTRIVVTGRGCIASIGSGVRDFTEGLFAGRNGIAPITAFDTTGIAANIAAEVRDYDADAHFTAKEQGHIDRFAQFAMVTARAAVAEAGLEIRPENAERVAVVHGTGIGGQTTHDASYHRLLVGGKPRQPPMTVPKIIPSSGASMVSMDLGITGPAFATTSACASSSHAIGIAVGLLRSGLVDVALTGGSEACICLGTTRAWEGLRVLSKDTCRPFSAGRSGLVLGEGAAALVLETLDHARARGATILAEVAGIGMAADAHHLVQPLAEGAARAMRAALADARLAPTDIDHVNAHGTGTPQNDPTETAALHLVFGDHAARLPVSATKSMHGHTLGAAGALEALAALAALERQAVPPTINWLGADPDCDLDYVPNQAREATVDTVMSNSFAFGGLNAVLIFRAFRG